MDLNRVFHQKGLKFILKGLITIFLLIGIVSFLKHEQERLLKKHKFDRLNLIAPDDFRMLTEVLEQGGTMSGTELAPYIKFFMTTAKYFPHNYEAQGLAGFCFYHFGDYKKSLEQFEKAFDQNPHFFIYPYNIAVIYYQARDYPKAVEYLAKVIPLDANEALKAILESKFLYQVFFVNQENTMEAFRDRLIKAYRNAYELLILSSYHLQDYPNMIHAAEIALSKDLNDKGFFHYYAGLGYYLLKDYTKAMAYFEKTLEVNNNFILATHYMGLTLKELGQEEQAQKYLAKTEMFKNARILPIRKIGTEYIQLY